MIRIVVSGAAGRVGREVIAALTHEPEIELVGGLVRSGSPLVGEDLGTIAGGRPLGLRATAGSDVDDLLARTGVDVLVDFSHADAVPGYAEAAARQGCAFLTGTSGLSPAQVAEVRQLGEQIPVLLAANVSVGIAAVLAVLPTLLRMLGPGYDIEIIETHHRYKADAPSGTALAIADVLTAAQDGPADRIFGRQGRGMRRPGEIAIHAVRAGDVIGEHRIIFATEGEQTEIVHRATSRRVYGSGALRAAAWLSRQQPGVYTMADVVNGLTTAGRGSDETNRAGTL